MQGRERKGRKEWKLTGKQRLVHNQMARAKVNAMPKAGTAEEEIIGVTKA